MKQKKQDVDRARWHAGVWVCPDDCCIAAHVTLQHWFGLAFDPVNVACQDLPTLKAR